MSEHCIVMKSNYIAIFLKTPMYLYFQCISTDIQS